MFRTVPDRRTKNRFGVGFRLSFNGRNIPRMTSTV
jgi:hypothetical protein